MVLAHDWTADGLPADIIKGVILVTGVMDCEPVLDITVNEGVRLEPVAARRLSPPRNPPQRALPLLIAVRGAEQPLWNKMSQDYAVPCRADGIECGYMDMPNRDLGVSSLVDATLTMMSPLTPCPHSPLSLPHPHRASKTIIHEKGNITTIRCVPDCSVNCGRDAGCPAPPAQFRTCPLRHPAPPLGCAGVSADGKSLARPRMSDFQPGPIGVHKGLESGPLEAVLLRATA